MIPRSDSEEELLAESDVSENLETSEPAVQMASEASEEDEKEPKKSVSIRQYFRYATSLDYLLMIVGLIGSIGAGCTFPLLTIVLGDMVDLLVTDKKIKGG